MIDEERQDDDAPMEDSEPTAAPDEVPAGAGDDAPAEDAPAAEAPAEETPAAEAPAEETPAAEAPAEEPAAETPAAEDAPAEDAPAAEAAPSQRPPRPKADAKADEPEVIPGAHLEPDLVLEQPSGEDDQYSQYADADETPDGEGDDGAEAAPAVRSPLDLAADARYQATGKRKTAIARVIVKPGSGNYTVNGRSLEEFFPRIRLQKAARQPLEATGNHQRMDVVARIHGGGVAAQAGALRHGIARALVDASPELRTELKRRGYLTRDPREKERKKAGLKKARKRPQFSKR